MGCHTWFYRNKEYLDKQLSCEYHNLFRAYDIDEDKFLSSLEETLNYIKDNDCEVYEFTNKKLEEFFTKYPDGVIEFG